LEGNDTEQMSGIEVIRNLSDYFFVDLCGLRRAVGLMKSNRFRQQGMIR
jgi:hypothetical protein